MIKITQDEFVKLTELENTDSRRLRVEFDHRGIWLPLDGLNLWARNLVHQWRNEDHERRVAAEEAARLAQIRKEAQLRKLLAEQDIKAAEDAQQALAAAAHNAMHRNDAAETPQHQPTEAERKLWCKCGNPFHFGQAICPRYVEDLERAVRSHRDRLDHVQAKHGVTT